MKHLKTLGVILIFLTLLAMSKCVSDNSRVIDAYKALGDSLSVKIDSKGRETASIQVIEANKRMLLDLKTKDSTINWLKEVVKDYRGKISSATVLSNSTSSTGRTNTIYLPGDTVIKDSVIFVYPIYETSWSNRWGEGYIKAGRDSIFRDIKVKNEYEFVIGKERRGFLKKRLTRIKVTNLNPNTYTKEMRSFDVLSEQKRISIGVQTGYGIGLKNMKPTPYIGVGIQFNLIGIK